MDSRTYWRKREEKWIRQNIRRDRDLVKKIRDELQDAYDDIQQDIDSFYARYATKEGITIAEARKAVAKHDVQKFTSKAKKYVETKDFSPRANEELRLYNLTMKINRLEMLKAQINLRLTGSMDDINQMITDEMVEQTIEEFERNAGILGDSAKFDVVKRAQLVVDGSFKLKDGLDFANFSDYIWLYKTELVNDLEKLLVRSFTQGENPRVMARELKKRFNVTGYQAERLARTESSRISAEVQRQSFIDNEMEEYEIIAEPSACKGICKPLDGRVFKVKDMVIGKNANPFHPNCRCSIVGHIDSRKLYNNWLENGVITKEDYDDLNAFRDDYDKKFEVLMAKRNAYEASMQKKRKERRLK